VTSASATALRAIHGTRQGQEPGKRFATLQARAALAGVALAAIEDDAGRPAYVMTRWALTRQLDSLDAVERWLDQLTGAAA
jgi:hypothetical protein